ncbi:MAG: amino acid permease [Symbiobacteriia bacterium]
MGTLDVVMLGFGSIIGAGFFVASGLAVRQAGPGILLGFVIGAVGFVGVLSALAEMATANPAPGGFRTYAREALGPYMGFTVGWMYWTSGVLTMSSEVTAAALLANYWLPHWPLWLLSLLFSLLITGINFMDTRGFGEVETVFAGVKVIALTAFIAIGAYAILRGLGGLHPAPAAGVGSAGLAGFFPTGARGVAASMLMVMFTYAGVQVVGMVAPDTRDTARTMPRAIGILSVSLIGLYLASFAVLLLVLPWQQVSTQSSPFVQALQRLGLLWASPVMNLVILTAALSALNSSLYGVSRMLYALSLDKEAPGVFQRKTPLGIPGWALAGSSAVLVIAIVLAYLLPRQAYLYITSAGGFISMFNWLIIGVTHLRYRPLLLRRQPDRLVYRAIGFPTLTWATILITAAVLLTTPLARGQIVGLVVGVSQFILVSLVYVLFIRPRERRRLGGAD